jgi:hypothetical protein
MCLSRLPRAGIRALLLAALAGLSMAGCARTEHDTPPADDAGGDAEDDGGEMPDWVVDWGVPDGGFPTESCHADPWGCLATETCWLATDGRSLVCQTAGAGLDGESCVTPTDAATCGAGLACLVPAGVTTGACTPFCGAGHPCPAGRECVDHYLIGPEVIIGLCTVP